MRAHYLTEIRLQVKRQSFADKFLKVSSGEGDGARSGQMKREKKHSVRREWGHGFVFRFSFTDWVAEVHNGIIEKHLLL